MDNVGYNRASVVVSAAFMINLIAMPLKAYMSEDSPFSIMHYALASADGLPRANHTNTVTYAAMLATRFANATDLYTYNATLKADVIRSVFATSIPGCSEAIITQVTGSMYTPSDVTDQLTVFLCGNKTIPIARVGASFMLTAPTAIYGIWSTPGDLTAPWPPDPTKVTITFMYAAINYSALWITLKFCLRLCVSLLIAGEAYRLYYRHVHELRRLLRRYPLHPQPTAAVRYEIILGEPTTLISSHPIVILAFIVDFWASIEVVGQAILRVSQTKSLHYFILGAIFLSRSVWFSYGTLTALNAVLHRCKARPIFRPSNTTVVAVTSFVYAGVATMVQNTSIVMLHLYSKLLIVGMTPNAYREYFDTQSFPSSVIYSLILCAMPFATSIPRAIVKHIYLRLHPEAKYVKPPVGGPRDLRFRFMAWYGNFKTQFVGKNVLGGSIYKLFAMDPRFRSVMTIGQNGTDCFVFGFDAKNGLVEVTRVSLLSRVNLRLLGIHLGSKAVLPRGPLHLSPNLAVGRVHLPEGSTGLSLDFGAENSPWLA
ncbi:hypothetical protein ACHHYP_02524 [Achlya hypogyna]|uniref:Transmembrane protein n=1 Tax=Achlya hypogyna TaxID=1202772 RepID=A0A1V9Z616_ACHHY|nr:hypothetical protein ACHHYP_02524 [Achlya hypogyna]